MIDQTKLSAIEKSPLSKGSHSGLDDGMCVMEAVAYVAGEKWTDSPQCACPVISAFLRNWNDALDDETRQKLKPYVLRLVGTKSTPEIESRRAWMATDWLVRVYTPAWLRLAKLDKQADLLESLRELTGADDCQPIIPALKAIRNDAHAAKAAAWGAAWGATWAAAWDAARDAAWDAAWVAARDAAWAAAWAAAWDAARDAAWAAAKATARDAAWAAAWDAAKAAAKAAAWAAAWDAARDAAWATARDALKPTVKQIQETVFVLIDRMIDATEKQP